MVQHGTVRNGVIVPDAPVGLADGTRVVFEPAPADWPDDLDHPPAETHEEHIAILRQSVEDKNAGRGRPLAEVMADITAEFGLPPVRKP